MKKLIALISEEGKSLEQLQKEAKEAWVKYQAVSQRVFEKKNTQPIHDQKSQEVGEWEIDFFPSYRPAKQKKQKMK